MPSYAIKSSGIRQVADGKILGNNSGGVGPALELSPADLNAMGVGGNPFDQDLNTTDSPTFNIVNVSAGEGKGINFGNGDLRMYSRNANRICLAGDINESIEFHVGGEGGVNVRDEGWFGFSSNNNPDTADTYIRRDAAGTLRFSNGGSSYTLNLYGTRTDASNYERLSTKFDGTRYLISAESAGTGSNREVRLKASNGSIYVNTGTYFAQIRDANNNERYDFADGYVRNRVNANLGTTSMRWGQAFLGGETVTTSSPMLDLSQTWNDAGVEFDAELIDITDTASDADSKLIRRQVGGLDRFSVNKTGTIHLSEGVTNGPIMRLYAGGQAHLGMYGVGYGLQALHISSLAGISLRNTQAKIHTIGDCIIRPDTAITEVRDDTTAQSFSVANTWTDASNHERGIFDWTTTANTLTIGTEAAGTGSARNIDLVTGGTARITIEDHAYSNSNFVFTATTNNSAKLEFGGSAYIQRSSSGGFTVTDSAGTYDLLCGSINLTSGFLIRANVSNQGVTTWETSTGDTYYTRHLLRNAGGSNRTTLEVVGRAMIGRSYEAEVLTEAFFADGLMLEGPLHAYNSFTNETNYERGVFDWTTTADTLTIGTEAAGTGTNRNLVLNGAGDTRIHGAGVLGIRVQSGGINFYHNVYPTAGKNLGQAANQFGTIFLQDGVNQQTSTAADPTTTEYATDGDWGIHENTTSGNIYLAFNNGGSIVKVQLT